jgi:methyl-accepting chemotaxis protein
MTTWFKKLRLGKKIALGYGLIFFIMLIGTAINYFEIQSLENINTLSEKSNNLILLADKSFSGYLALKASHLQYLVGGKEESLQTYYDAEKTFNEQVSALDKIGNELKENHERLITINKLAEDQFKQNRVSIALVKKGEREKADLAELEGIQKNYTSDIKKLFNELKESENAKIEVVREQRAFAISAVLWTSLGGTIIAILIGIFLAFFITKSVVGTVGDAINAIAATSAEMAATINEHEKVASQQAASVNETTSTMNELDVTFSQTAAKVSETASSADKASEIADGGAKTVQLTMDTMSVLKDKVTSIAEQILRLSEQTSQIGSITALVTDLASQTNLLALNAAVEAARAGEHGKGFAVVATEIRKLADQSKKSAEKINTLVADIQKATNSTVMATEEGTKNVDLSISAARKTAEAFNEIASFINTTFDVSQQTVFTVKQQVSAVKQVVEAMNAINAGVKETASGLSQTRVGVQKLNETASSLNALV